MITLPCLALILAGLILLPDLLPARSAEPSEMQNETGDRSADDAHAVPEGTEAEIVLAPGSNVTEEGSAADDPGQGAVCYQFPVGPNGYLLWKGTREESYVFPVDEDGDGYPEYGLYLVEPEAPEDPTEPVQQPYYAGAALFLPDGSPVDYFESVPVPAAQQKEKRPGWLTVGSKEYYRFTDGSYAVGLQRIDGKLYFFGPDGVKARSVGLDVSYYNNDIDWKLVKSQGIDFAIIRVGGRGWSKGQLYDDCRTLEYLRGARDAGIRIGAYFYSTAVNPYEAVEEAKAALKVVSGIQLDFPIFIDMEFSGEYPRGRADRLSPSERAEIAIAFCETVRSSGYQAGIYSSQNFMKACIDYYAISRYTVWIASYTVDNQLPAFTGRYDIWQFTGWGKVDGVFGDADLNVIF